jgi:hypothetical protein
MSFFDFQQTLAWLANFLTNASNPKSTKIDPFSSCAKVIV